MTNRNDIVNKFKADVAVAITRAEAWAKEEGIPPLTRHLQAETLELAARMHDGGSDNSWIIMAKRALSLVRSGTVEQ